jgi:immune inhibitor A
VEGERVLDHQRHGDQGDYAYNDNKRSRSRARGFVLPVDARPAPIKFPTGAPLGNRRQPFDASFGQEATTR